jgi:pentatricopeptide repeat protein
MVFKPFTTLARQSISRHFVNGYAQSVVAATQSSYASSTLPLKFGQKDVSAKFQNAFGGAHSGRAQPGKDGSGSDSVGSFHAAQSTIDDKEDKKYLFSKKILWSKAQHQQQQKQLLGNPPEPIAELAPSKSRASSFGSATAEEIELEAEEAELKEAESAIADEAVELAEDVPTEEPQQTAESLADILLAEPEPSPATQDFNFQLQTLRDQGRWEEVTVLFRHMTEQGIPANTTSYNLLLDSIINLRPRYVAQVIDVYSAMLREELIPTTSTYSILINFLAGRALRSLKAADSIERDALRFGVKLAWKTQEVEEMRKEGAMDYALGLFYDSTEAHKERIFPTFVYEALIEACSKYRRDDDMLKVYSHMEAHGVAPTSEIIGSLIRGFGRTGDIRSAIETYNSWFQLSLAQDPASMDQRYMIYRDLIKAYMDSGDAAGALTFLEKVVDISREPARLEWLKQAVIEGFVNQGDIQSARKWASQLSIQHTSSEWLASLMTRVADQDELDFSRQIYNTIDFDNTSINRHEIKIKFAQSQESCLGMCTRKNLEGLSRDLWTDLNNREKSAGPSVPAMLGFTQLLFKSGKRHEALVHINNFSVNYLERFGPSPESKMELRSGFEHLIVFLSQEGILEPSVALDLSGFSVQFSDGLGPHACHRVVRLFDTTRIMGLTGPQLVLILQLQHEAMSAFPEHMSEHAETFEAIFEKGLAYELPICGPLAGMIENGTAMLANIKPQLQAKWFNYVQDVQQRAIPPTVGTFRYPSPMTLGSPVSFAPSTSTIIPTSPITPTTTTNENMTDPYGPRIDRRASEAIETAIDRTDHRNRAARVTEVRRIYRNARRQGRSPRLTTLAKMVAFASPSRGGSNQDFIEEIIRNAKHDLPLMKDNTASRVAWSYLLDAMIAVEISMGNRNKAHEYHQEMRDMGAAPSANTFGLYIVYLKDSHQTHDEASDAVQIFKMAMEEGVQPTSFLFNAVIGKLSKARRVDDCLSFFIRMRVLGIKPTSVTFGTMINALTRVGDENLAVELFNEMETQTNYRPRPAPYNSIIQFYVETKHDRSKALEYYQRMLAADIEPTSHTYKLLIEAYATLEEPDLEGAERVMAHMEREGRVAIEAVHHSALIHAKGCVFHDVEAAIKHFDNIINTGRLRPDATLYQALIEVLVGNHRVAETDQWVQHMNEHKVEMTPYIANSLIHGWATEQNIKKAKEVYNFLGGGNGRPRREPSTYEQMARAYLAVGDRRGAQGVLNEMRGRGYPVMVVQRVQDLVSAPVAHF